MKTSVVCLSLGLMMGTYSVANANLLTNGDLDVTYQQQINPNLLLPKPNQWVNEAFRTVGGPYEDEMSSEPWAGPSPTPVTTNGFNVTTGADTDDDWAVFWKPFSGNSTDGSATGHLYQDVAGSSGLVYTLTGWAGAEANALMEDAVFAIDFRDAAGALLSTSSLSLMSGLFVDNGLAFDYKLYSVTGTAPTGTAFVRSRVSMINATGNPAGGGQAFVVDDFSLTVVPEPATMMVLGAGALALMRRRRKA